MHDRRLHRQVRRPARLHIRRARVRDEPGQDELELRRARAAGGRGEVDVQRDVGGKDRSGRGREKGLRELGGELGVEECG